MAWPVDVAAAGAQPWINPRGFLRAGRRVGTGARVPTTDAGAGAGERRGTRGVGRVADEGAA